MTTATLAAMTERAEETRQRRVFEHMVEAFAISYRPDGDRGAEFDSALHVLVRQIYRDAQQPLLDQMNKMLMATPTSVGYLPGGRPT